MARFSYDMDCTMPSPPKSFENESVDVDCGSPKLSFDEFLGIAPVELCWRELHPRRKMIQLPIKLHMSEYVEKKRGVEKCRVNVDKIRIDVNRECRASHISLERPDWFSSWKM